MPNIPNKVLVVIGDKFWSFHNRLSEYLQCKALNKAGQEAIG